MDKKDFKWAKAAEMCLPSNHILNKSEILFTKIEDSEIEGL